MTYKKFKGIIPAFYACYDDQGNISTERVKELAHYSATDGKVRQWSKFLMGYVMSRNDRGYRMSINPRPSRAEGAFRNYLSGSR